MNSLLVIENLSYQKNNEYLFQNLNLSVSPREIVAVYGGINSGKTALVDLIAGFSKPKSGQVVRVPNIAVVTQQFILYPDLTTLENLEFSAAINNFPENGLAEIIRVTGLAGWEYIRAGRLPSALKTILQLACALARDFDLLILDEVTAGLDTHYKQILWKLIDRLLASGKGILFATGLWDDANRCDSIFNLPSGEMITSGRMLTSGETLAKESPHAVKMTKKTLVPVKEPPVVAVETGPTKNTPDNEVTSEEASL